MDLSYKWKLADGYPPLNRGKVFSCFACGGGSTMGYKLAGFEVIGCNEIDPRMMAAYQANHHPKYSYLEDIRTFKNRVDLPKELFELDILDGSPPCSSFSMAGSREDGWGVEKKFREGQAEQVLDTLFFDFIDLAKRLQPKVVIAENVKGLLLGEARTYYHKINDCFQAAGYEIQDFLFNAADMGVPQKRERIFFIGLRKDICAPFMEPVDMFTEKPRLQFKFTEKHIPFSELSDSSDTEKNMPEKAYSLWLKCEPGSGLDTVSENGSYFTEYKAKMTETLKTLTAQGKTYHPLFPRRLNSREVCMAFSFPTDYNFLDNHAHYITGMSVPPLMVARIADQIYKQWLSKLEVK